jgi:putative membrane protein
MLLKKPIHLGYILNKVKFNIIYTLLVSLSVLFVTNKFKEWLPEMPLTIPTFIGTAISILLSFKLSQSYDRWWEARKIWGSIVNDSRSLVIQLKSFVEDENDPMIKTIALRQIAWCYCLGQSLRGLNPTENLNTLISEKELKGVEAHSNKPLAMLSLHAEDIKKLHHLGKIDRFSHLQLDKTLVSLCDSQGRCERIKNTVFPVTYRILLHAMIYLFVITLAVSLRVDGFYETPLLIAISTAFFLLEKTATHMQDPFENRPTDTAMTSIARTIEINLKQMIDDKEVPLPYKADKFFLN